MKTSLALGSALAILLVSGVSSAAIVPYKAVLNGKQEVPANASAATGTTTNLVFNDAAAGGNSKELSGTITLVGIAATSAQHIHIGACGVAGAVSITLPAPVANVITIPANTKLNAAQETALVAGNLYINVHSATFGGGEIRGQIYPAASTTACPVVSDAGTEAGTDSGTSGSSGASGTSGTSGTSGASGGTSGASGGTSGTSGGTSGTSGTSGDAAPADGGSSSGGCSTTAGTQNESGFALLGLAGLAIAVIVRSRRIKKS